MTDLERFLLRLVDVLEARDPGAVHQPLTVADLRETVLPYRANRSALELSAIEDYEALVLRLIAEEDGMVLTYPADSAELARAELAGPNPDLDLTETLSDTTILIGAEGLARVLALRTRRPPADPGPDDAPPDAGEPVAEAAEPTSESDADTESGEPPAGREGSSEPPETDRPPVALFAGQVLPARSIPLEEEFEPLADSVSVDDLVSGTAGFAPASSAGPPPPSCPTCRAELPAHRPVSFCPFCGDQVGRYRCSRCGSEVEPGWRHCITCGHAVSPGTFG